MQNQRLSATSNHNAKRWMRSSLTANSRTKRWPSPCRREIASRICGAYPVLDRGNEDTTAFQVSSSVSQLDDLHKASKTLAGMSIAITGMPDRTAEWTRKLISNAVASKKVSVRKIYALVLTLVKEYLLRLLPLLAGVSWKDQLDVWHGTRCLGPRRTLRMR